MANPYKALRDLIPEPAMQVGTSQGPNGDGTTDVILVGGGTVTATGTGYAFGTPVFVKGGLIVSQAPSLSVTDIEV
jgi:hypothetical protein